MASPAKRRVLAPLDANTSVTAASPLSLAGKAAPSENNKLPLSPPSSAIAKKRTLPETSLDEDMADSTTPPKKPCLASNSPLATNQQQQQAPPALPVATTANTTSRPSLSPATSSVFDLSAMVDTSQATNITEPDVDVPRAAQTVSRTLTREQSRQRAEILRLRLGLAQYKLRTGQVDVPLEHLRVVSSASASQRQKQQSQSQSQLSVSREWSAGEWVRQQQEQKQADAAAHPRQQPPLPQRWALWGPASSSTGGAPGSRGRDQAGSSDEEDNQNQDDDDDDDDALDSRPLPQQPRHQLDTVNVIEDSDVSDQDAPRRQDDEDENDDEEDGDLPQLPQIRRLSPTKQASSAKHNPLTTPRGNRLFVDDGNGSHLDRLTSSAMRGSAVNGLLSLARS